MLRDKEVGKVGEVRHGRVCKQQNQDQGVLLGLVDDLAQHIPLEDQRRG